MRSLILCLALTLSGGAMADELADANRALAAKSYPAALQLFTRLADAGNPEAQLRLGEMYWYGEGVGLDRAKGDALFAKAAAAGNQEAAAAQALSAQRAGRGADIAFWTSGYDGADLTAGKYSCAAPAIPEVSQTNAEITAVNAAIAAWRDCHNGFADNLNAALPAGKRVPPDVAILMSEQETQQAKAHLGQVYDKVMDKAQASSAAILARREKWEAATVVSVDEQNRRAAEARTRQAQAQMEQERMLRGAGVATRTAPSTRK